MIRYGTQAEVRLSCAAFFRGYPLLWKKLTGNNETAEIIDETHRDVTRGALSVNNATDLVIRNPGRKRYPLTTGNYTCQLDRRKNTSQIMSEDDENYLKNVSNVVHTVTYASKFDESIGSLNFSSIDWLIDWLTNYCPLTGLSYRLNFCSITLLDWASFFYKLAKIRGQKCTIKNDKNLIDWLILLSAWFDSSIEQSFDRLIDWLSEFFSDSRYPDRQLRVHQPNPHRSLHLQRPFHSHSTGLLRAHSWPSHRYPKGQNTLHARSGAEYR